MVELTQVILMNALTLEPVAFRVIPELPKGSVARAAEDRTAFILESILVRDLSRTPLMKRHLEPQPYSHWGLNE
jgi:hypothetical protein